MSYGSIKGYNLEGLSGGGGWPPTVNNVLYGLVCYNSTVNLGLGLDAWPSFVGALLQERSRPLSSIPTAAAAEFICHEKNIHVYINVKDRRAARKE